MKVLVLGGSGFVGPAFVAAARERGGRVAVFNRGTRPPADDVDLLIGDRTAGDLDALDAGEFDVVVDTWTGPPAAVTAAVERLRGRAGAYVYVSSVSVYRMPSPPGSDESAPLVEGDADDTEPGDYAAAKRGGELAALRHDGPVVLARAGLILGPQSNVGRLSWWLRRMQRGGEVLTPGPPDQYLQFIDSRDLAAFSLDVAAAGRSGAYTLVCPPRTVTYRRLFEACRAVTGSDAVLRWVTPDVIEEAGIAPWTELPMWLPPGDDHDSMLDLDVSAALAAGLTCRSVEETVGDTWAWLEEVGKPVLRTDLSHGLDPAREAAALALASRR